ncbi:site-specific integrase [Salinadaptatus halalkaliphilus]|uniref:Site-specific integrase n=1 Tax=Salinadaptatus halalkaliphilus TaxID=2419781 RepID=A0A4S3TKM4_9EURY|nr:site-specific integrase [Salinadaptatus halalkaliphilus]THE63128.1 site-specific integrase [Salinadaptatus halalkaliphilus]
MSRSDAEQESESNVEQALSFDGVRWTSCSLEDFADLYWDEIAPCLETEGFDPTSEKPTHQWFQNHDARSFLAALRRHHDRSFGEFWNKDLGLGDNKEGYTWATTDEATIDALEQFLNRRKSRYSLASSSIEAMRTRLNLYVRAYQEANGTGDLLTPILRGQENPAYEAVDAVYAAFDWLNEGTEDKYSAQTLQRVRRVVDAWYQHLVGRRVTSMNPASGLYDEFKWEVEESPTPSLSANHIQKLMQASETTQEQLLVVALAGWGLRASEVAALHVSQFHRDVPEDDVPFITFESRKNGPGQVSLLYGMDVLDSRIDELAEDDTWTRYLFPSSQGEMPYVTRDTIRNWFQNLASEADLPERIEGKRPSPQLCRRFWYDTYTVALEGVLEGINEIAAEQGSSDPQVVMQNYLSDSRSRQVRREFMQDQLNAAFGERT